MLQALFAVMAKRNLLLLLDAGELFEVQISPKNESEWMRNERARENG